MASFGPKIISNISITWKFRLAAMGFFLPVAIMLYMLVSEKNVAINFTKQELIGTAYLRPLGEIYKSAWAYNRDRLSARIFPERKDTFYAKIDKALKNLNEYDQAHSLLMKSSPAIQEVRTLRKSLKNMPDSIRENGGDVYLLSRIRLAMNDIGDTFSLILDPDLDSYYLMHAVLMKIPEETFQIYELTHYLDAMDATGKIDADKMAAMLVLNGLLKSNIEKIQGNMRNAFNDNPEGDLIYKLQKYLSSAVEESAFFSTKIDSIIKAKRLHSKAEYETAAIRAVEANYRLWEISLNELEGLLHGRIDELNQKIYLELISIGSVLLLTTLLFVFISKQVVHSVETLNNAANKVAIGDLNTAVDINGKDELGNLGLNFNKMVGELRNSIKEKTDRFEETEKALNYKITQHIQAEEATSQQLRNLSSRLQTIREEERTMIAREIHDELGQVLTVLKIQISLLSNKLREDQSYLKEKIESASRVIDRTVESVQRISAKLRPGILDDLGLIPAIEWQAQDFQESTGINCRLSLLKEEVEMDQEKSTAIFRIFQEALTNVARHASADMIYVGMRTEEKNLVLEIEDNGRGITREQLHDSRSLGLLGMRERAYILGGTVIITGKPGMGTSVKVSMPVLI